MATCAVGGSSGHKGFDVVQLQAKVTGGGIVQQHYQLQAGTLTTQWNPSGYVLQLAILINTDALPRNRSCIFDRFRIHRNHGTSGGSLLRPQGLQGTRKCKPRAHNDRDESASIDPFSGPYLSS